MLNRDLIEKANFDMCHPTVFMTVPFRFPCSAPRYFRGPIYRLVRIPGGFGKPDGMETEHLGGFLEFLIIAITRARVARLYVHQR